MKAFLRASTAAVLGVGLGVIPGSPTVRTQSATRQPHMFLAQSLGLSQDEIAPIDRGDVVTAVIDTEVDNEAAIIGSVRVRATTEFFLRMYRDIERFETGWGVTKKLSDPPQLSDFGAWVLSEEDIDDLEDCRVGDCGVQASEQAIEEIQNTVDWNTPNAAEQVNTLVRRRMFDGVMEYRAGGNRALGVYRYQKRPLAVQSEFEGLVKNSPYILSYRPELHRWLHDYPDATLPGAEDFIYWSQVELGPKPVMRINHVVIYQPDEGENAGALIASKQLFFSHYFNVGLELHMLTQDPDHPDDGFFLTSLNRYRSQSITGMFGGLVRRQAVGAAQESLNVYLGRVKDAAERYYAAEKSQH